MLKAVTIHRSIRFQDHEQCSQMDIRQLCNHQAFACIVVQRHEVVLEPLEKFQSAKRTMEPFAHRSCCTNSPLTLQGL